MLELIKWNGTDGEELSASWPGDFRKELDELLLRFFGENLPVSAVVLAAFDMAAENGNGNGHKSPDSLDSLSKASLERLSAAGAQRPTATDIVRAMDDRDFRVLDDFSQVELALESLSNEESLELRRTLNQTMPWLEERIERLKSLAKDMEERYSALVDYMNI